MAVVYILRSLKNHRFYIGSTSNLTRRLTEHKLGKSSYTRNILPIELVFKQEFESLAKAKKVENWLKKQKSNDLLNKIIVDSKIKKDFD